MHSQRYIDAQNGVISRDIFVEKDVYDAELERIFARAWLFVGHESQVPNPGDFITSRMGEESVILARDHDRKLHVMLNSCRHRGMKVCRYESGNTELFQCPYHAWAYGLDGELRGVPHDKLIYDGGLDRSAWSLIPVAQMSVYKGTVWATWDPGSAGF